MTTSCAGRGRQLLNLLKPLLLPDGPDMPPDVSSSSLDCTFAARSLSCAMMWEASSCRRCTSSGGSSSVYSRQASASVTVVA